MFSLIVAVDKNKGIGIKNQLPWRLKKDMAFFKKLTMSVYPSEVLQKYGLSFKSNSKIEDREKELQGQNAVIMGRKTWESIPAKFRPLPNRVNIVLSRQSLVLPQGVLLAHSLDEALKLSSNNKHTFVIGGANIYQQALEHCECQTLYVTKVNHSFNCDAFFPAFEKDFELQQESEGYEEESLSFCFQVWKREGVG